MNENEDFIVYKPDLDSTSSEDPTVPNSEFWDEELLALEIANAIASGEDELRKSRLKLEAAGQKDPLPQNFVSSKTTKVVELHSDPAFLEQLRTSYALDYNYVVGSDDLYCDINNEFTEEALFGMTSIDPFVVEDPVKGFVHLNVDHSKPTVITRQIEAFNEAQMKSRVPRLAYGLNDFKPTSAVQNRYKKNRDFWDNLLKELGLDEPDVLDLILKPDFYDVVPMLISRFKAGVMPHVSTTWTISPRFIPEDIYLRISANNPEVTSVTDDKKNGVLMIGSNIFHYYHRVGIKQNLYRRLLIREHKRLNLGIDKVVRNLKYYHESMRMVRHIPRFFRAVDKISYTTVNNILKQFESGGKTADAIFANLFHTIARYKLFRYTFEDRNREYLYYAPTARSSYYRYESFLPPFHAKKIVIFAPDKRFMHHCFIPFFELARGNLMEIIYVSDLSFVEHVTDHDHAMGDAYYMGVKFNVMSLKAFYTAPPKADMIYIDFVEVKRKGSTIMGTYCEANRLALDMQRKKVYNKIVVRAGFSEVYPLYDNYNITLASLFKAGGLEFIMMLTYNEDYCHLDRCFNEDLLLKIAAVKTIVENDRRHYIIRGFDYRCIDPIFPVKDQLDFYFPDATFALSGQKFRPMAYQHSRATSKFTTKKEDLLDHFISLHDRESEDKFRGIANVLIHNNFDVSATAVQLAETCQYPVDENFIRETMLKIINVSDLRPDVKRAITTTTIVPKTMDYLKKKCPDIDRYMTLFEECGYDVKNEKLYRFAGVSELQSKNFLSVTDFKLVA